MRSKMSIRKTHRTVLYGTLVLLFLLPLLPFVYYWDWAWTFWSFALLSLGFTKIEQKERLVDWTFIGFIVFLGAIGLHFLRELVSKGLLPTSPQYLVFFLAIGSYFLLRKAYREVENSCQLLKRILSIEG